MGSIDFRSCGLSPAFGLSAEDLAENLLPRRGGRRVLPEHGIEQAAAAGLLEHVHQAFEPSLRGRHLLEAAEQGRHQGGSTGTHHRLVDAQFLGHLGQGSVALEHVENRLHCRASLWNRACHLPSGNETQPPAGGFPAPGGAPVDTAS